MSKTLTLKFNVSDTAPSFDEVNRQSIPSEYQSSAAAITHAVQDHLDSNARFLSVSCQGNRPAQAPQNEAPQPRAW